MRAGSQTRALLPGYLDDDGSPRPGVVRMAVPQRQGTPVVFYRRAAESFDHYIRDQVATDGFKVEWTYFGCETEARADEVRRGLRRAGQHLRVSVKVFITECQGCRHGGPECRYHVPFTSYDSQDARAYMAAKAATLQWGARR